MSNGNNFFANLLDLGVKTTQAVKQTGGPKRGRRKGKKREECTPCAAQAWVEALRPDGNGGG